MTPFQFRSLRPKHLRPKYLWRKAQQIRLFQYNPQHPSQQRDRGVTLPEILVAMVIATLVVALAFSGFITLSNMMNRTKLESERRIEFSRAFDFMTQEIRSANRVNQTATMIVDGVNTLATVLDNIGLNAAITNIPTDGEPVLYLEVPFSTPPTSACPAAFDQVIYDIRPNPTQWLGPRVITRYGRIPDQDGKTSPCSPAVTSDIMVDSVAEQADPPACSGQLTGIGGFFACVDDGLVKLQLESKVVDAQTIDIDSSALTRPSTAQNLAPTLSGTPTPVQMDLTWTWSGSTPPDLEFRVYRTANSGRTEVSDATANDLTASDLAPVVGYENCYSVTAVSGGYTSNESNSVCATF
jgi:prepilin-type N-terminal cleavage/methylation domain-containing protein